MTVHYLPTRRKRTIQAAPSTPAARKAILMTPAWSRHSAFFVLSGFYVLPVFHLPQAAP